MSRYIFPFRASPRISEWRLTITIYCYSKTNFSHISYDMSGFMDLGCNSQLLVTGSCSFLITGIQKLGFRCLVSGVRSDDLRSCVKLHLTNAEVGMWPPASPSCRLSELQALRAGSRRGHKGLRPGGSAEGWSRCAQSFLNRQNTFLRHSTFMIRYSIFAFSKFLFRSDWTLAARWRLYETSSEH
jgi:hypothetical protein